MLVPWRIYFQHSCTVAYSCILHLRSMLYALCRFFFFFWHAHVGHMSHMTQMILPIRPLTASTKLKMACARRGANTKTNESEHKIQQHTTHLYLILIITKHNNIPHGRWQMAVHGFLKGTCRFIYNFRGRGRCRLAESPDSHPLTHRNGKLQIKIYHYHIIL